MAMFLTGTATIIILRICRWSSKAFLEFIREKVEHFTLGGSNKMLQFEYFNTTASVDTLEIKISELGYLFIEI